MRLMLLLLAPALLVFGSCQAEGRPTSSPDSTASPLEVTASLSAPPEDDEVRHGWRKPRFISLAQAIERLQPHVDVPVVLPSDRMAGLPNLKGWLADPKYLDWNTVEGVRAGGMTIRKGKQILILSYGLSGFDGCGGRESAIETTIVDQPALVNPSGNRWSTVIWPVTDTGSTGRYGISGTFDAVAMVRLAESMEHSRLEAMDVAKGC
jgi:hypothetical protein